MAPAQALVGGGMGAMLLPPLPQGLLLGNARAMLAAEAKVTGSMSSA